MGPYIVRHLLGIGAAAVVVAALSVGWPVHGGVAQVDAAARDGVLTVGQCIEANDASVAPLEKALIEHDIIEDDLLQTKVTNGTCEDMLAQIPDGTPVGRVLAAQNYIQEIKLIEEAMRRADGEAAAKVTNRRFLATRPPVVAWTVVAAFQDAAEAQYTEPPAPSTAGPDPDGDSGTAPADGGGGTAPADGGGGTAPADGGGGTAPADGGGGAAPAAAAGGGGGAAPAAGGGGAAPAAGGGGGAAPAAGGGGDREGDGIGVTPTSKQAAAAASVAEDGDASIGERLRQKEEALKKEGASVPEARAGARCSTEVDVSDDEVKKSKGQFQVIPQMPKEMGHRETEQAGLLVTPVTKKRFEEIRQKHGDIEEVSESGIGCVELVDRMKAQLVPLDLEGLGIIRHHPDDIRDLSSNRDTRWGWGITARQTGNLELLLDLRYAISGEGQEFRLIPGRPVYEGAIWVTPFQSDSLLPSRDRPWLWVSLIGGGVVSTVIALVGLFLLWRRYKV